MADSYHRSILHPVGHQLQCGHGGDSATVATTLLWLWLLLICVSLNCLRHQVNETSYSLLIRISAAVCAAAACRLAAPPRPESEFEIWLMSKLQLFTAAVRWPPPDHHQHWAGYLVPLKSSW